MVGLRKKYKITMSVYVIVLILLLVIYLYRIPRFSDVTVLVYSVCMAIPFCLMRVIQNFYYRRGYYSKKQAIRFYQKCVEIGILDITLNQLETVREIYRETVYDNIVSYPDNKREKQFYRTIFFEGKSANKEDVNK